MIFSPGPVALTQFAYGLRQVRPGLNAMVRRYPHHPYAAEGRRRAAGSRHGCRHRIATGGEPDQLPRAEAAVRDAVAHRRGTGDLRRSEGERIVGLEGVPVNEARP